MSLTGKVLYVCLNNRTQCTLYSCSDDGGSIAAKMSASFCQMKVSTVGFKGNTAIIYIIIYIIYIIYIIIFHVEQDLVERVGGKGMEFPSPHRNLHVVETDIMIS